MALIPVVEPAGLVSVTVGDVLVSADVVSPGVDVAIVGFGVAPDVDVGARL